jgi:uncharacterized protein YjiS (DUF1127 family)
MSNRQCVNDDRRLTALLTRLARLVCETVIVPVRRRTRRRPGAGELARLDDHLLRDIGLTRPQVLAAAFGPVGSKWHSPVDPAGERLAGEGKVVRLRRRASAERVDDVAAAPLPRRAAQA